MEKGKRQSREHEKLHEGTNHKYCGRRRRNRLGQSGPKLFVPRAQNPANSEVNINPWCNVLKNMQAYYSEQNECSLTDAATGIFHVDIHGKQNDGTSDLDLGLHCIAYDIDKRQRLRDALAFEFKKIFRDTDFTINAYPQQFGGNWGMHFISQHDANDDGGKSKRSRVKRIIDEGVHPSRLTLASFSATLNMYSVQLELSKRLRDHLIRDQLLLTKFGDAIEFVYRNITSELDRSKAFAHIADGLQRTTEAAGTVTIQRSLM